MTSIRESNVDVLVVGAGPAGLMCSNGLAKAGVHVRVIDQRCVSAFLVLARCLTLRYSSVLERPIKVAAGQADGIQPRTIEVLQVRLLIMSPLVPRRRTDDL